MVDQHKSVASVAIRLKDADGNLLDEDQETIRPGTYTLVGNIEQVGDLESHNWFVGLIARWKLLGHEDEVLATAPFPLPKLTGKLEGNIEGELGTLTIDERASVFVLGGYIFNGKSMEGLQFLKFMEEERFPVVRE